MSPPFRYEAFVNPYVSSIGELLLHRGDIAARAAETVGAAQARAIEASGNAWATATQNIGQITGQTVAAIPQQIAAARAARQRDTLTQMAIDKGQREQGADQMAAAAMAGSSNPLGPNDVGPQLPNFLRKEGDVMVWDTDALSKHFAAAGYGDQMSRLLKDVQGVNQAHRDEYQARIAAQTSQTNLIAKNAGLALGMWREGVDPLQAVDTLMQPMLANKSVDPEQWQPIRDRMEANPAQIPAMLTALSRAGNQAPIKGAPGDQFFDPNTRAPIPSMSVPEKKPDYTINGQRFAGGTDTPIGDPVPPQRPPAQKALQRESVMLDGKPAVVLVDPDPAAAHRVFDLGGTPIDHAATRVAPMPPASVQVSNRIEADARNVQPVDASRPDPATANTVNPKTLLTPNAEYQASLVYGLEGKLPTQARGNSSFAMAAKSAVQNKAGAIAAAAGVDLPTVQAEYRANSAALSKLLPQAQATATFANTASDNLDLALSQSDQVARSGSKLVNRYLQWAQGEWTPAKGLTQFETYVYTAAREYAKVTSGAAASSQGLTDAAQREASKLLSVSQAPEAFGAAAQAMKNDMRNVVVNQTQGLARISSTIANFFAAANGGGSVAGTPQTQNQPPSPAAAPVASSTGGTPVAPSAQRPPQVGERRIINGQLAEWRTINGQSGWVAVQPSPR